MTFKEKYKEELSNIRFTDKFEENTVSLLTEAAERKDNVIMVDKRKTFKVAVLVVAAIMILSCTAFAVASLLTSSEVANHFGEKELAIFFEETAFKTETIKGEEYSVTFMGMAAGENLYKIDGIEINSNRTYAVVAIYRNDGEALNILDGSPIQIVPVADGYRPNALIGLGMSASGFEKDGVLYYLYDYTDLEVFADKNVSLVAFEGISPNADILTVNDNGEIVYAEDYKGFKGVFELDLDESKADPEAASKLISQF